MTGGPSRGLMAGGRGRRGRGGGPPFPPGGPGGGFSPMTPQMAHDSLLSQVINSPKKVDGAMLEVAILIYDLLVANSSCVVLALGSNSTCVLGEASIYIYIANSSFHQDLRPWGQAYWENK